MATYKNGPPMYRNIAYLYTDQTASNGKSCITIKNIVPIISRNHIQKTSKDYKYDDNVGDDYHTREELRHV